MSRRPSPPAPQPVHQPKAGWPCEAAERAVELAAGPILLGVKVTDQLTHGQHRPRSCPLGHHLLGKPAHRPALHLAVLEPAQDVLQVLEVALIHISEPTRRTPISYAVFCLKKK